MVKQMRFMIALFAMILLAVSFASAINVSTNSLSLIVYNGTSNSTNFIITNNETSVVNVSIGSILGLGTLTSSVSNSSFNLSVGENKTIIVAVSAPSAQVNYSFPTTPIQITTNGTPSVVNVNLNVNTIQNKPAIPVSAINYSKVCSSGIIGSSLLDVSDLTDESNVEDEWNWKAFDNIDVRVTLENRGDKDNEDYKLQLYFFDSTGKDVSNKFVDDTDSLKQEVSNLDSGDDTDVDFTFKLSSDVDSDEYQIIVKAIRTSKEKEQCIISTEDVSTSIDQEDEYAIVTDIQGPISTECGNTVDLTATVSNIGGNDQDRVKVILYNKDLGLNQFREVELLDSGDSATVLFSFAVPQNIQEKVYKLSFSTEFNYNDNKDRYDDESVSADSYVYSMTLSGNCVDPTKPSVSARLNSTALVGQDLVVEVTFKNNGNTSVSAIIAPEDYESWAKLVNNAETITIGRAESKKVYLTLTPTQAGQQTFNLNIIYNGKTLDQPVTVNIAKQTSFMNNLYDQFGKTGSYLIMGIIALIVLILLVLLVKTIVSRK